MLTQTTPDLRQTIRGYYDAWSRGDLDALPAYFAEQVAFEGVLKRGTTAADYLEALAGFAKLLTGANTLLSELYGEGEAMLFYESQTVAGPIRIVEHLRVTDGTISAVTLILDPTPLLAFRAAQAANQSQKPS